jgi:hypothetical protein
MRVCEDLRLRERVADLSGSAQGALDILVAGRFLEKNLNGAAGAPPWNNRFEFCGPDL